MVRLPPWPLVAPIPVAHPVQAILLDGVGTLFRVRDSVGAIYRAVAVRSRPAITAAELDAAFHAEMAAAGPMAFPGLTPDHLREMEIQWWYDRVYRTFARLDLPLDFATYRTEIYEPFRGAAWELYPESRATLLALRDRGLTVAVVSNFDSRLPDVLTALGIGGLIDHPIYASRHGVAKPNPRLFEIALAACGVTADHAIHVGDDLTGDVAGARAAGIQPILLSRDHHRLPSVDLAVIDRLDQLLPRLDRG